MDEVTGYFIVTEAQANAKEPWLVQHWSKDSDVPYADCWCDTCRNALHAAEPSLPSARPKL